jgi:hypothetical protein
MTEKILGQMEAAEFEALMEQFITERSGEDDRLPGEVFFELLGEGLREPAAIEVEGVVEGNRLRFRSPADARVPLAVRDNEILIGPYRICVQLVAEHQKAA